jgi:(p)ppGpp synthase/HD superfamily hydrolase
LDIEQLSAPQWDQLLLDLEIGSREQLFEEVGMGNRLGYVVAKRLAEQLNIAPNEDGHNKVTPMALKGGEKLLLNYARCCMPIPGDPIVGVITRGKGLVIHRENCNNVADIRADHQRAVTLAWDESMQGEFFADLRIDVRNQRGMLAQIASTIANAGSNIERIHMDDKDALVSQIHVNVNVRDRVHLAQIMRRLRLHQEVARVTRVIR